MTTNKLTGTFKALCSGLVFYSFLFSIGDSLANLFSKSANQSTSGDSVIALTPEEEFLRSTIQSSMKPSSSLIFGSKNPSLSGLVHSQSASAIVKNPTFDNADVPDSTFNYGPSGSCQNDEGKSLSRLLSRVNVLFFSGTSKKHGSKMLYSLGKQMNDFQLKQESMSNDDEESLCGRVNNLSAVENPWLYDNFQSRQLKVRFDDFESFYEFLLLSRSLIALELSHNFLLCLLFHNLCTHPVQTVNNCFVNTRRQLPCMYPIQHRICLLFNRSTWKRIK